MSASRALTLPQRVFLRMLQGMLRLTYGSEVAFAEELVAQYGVFGYIAYARATYPIWFQLAEFFTERDANLVASFASFWNGCDYCAYGHLYAYNLMYFQETGKLFPVDEQEVMDLLSLRDAQIIEALRGRLAGPEHQRAREFLERQYELKLGKAVAATETDAMLNKSLAYYDWVNECSIMFDAPAPPLGTVGRNKALMKRYADARAPERAKRASEKAAGKA